VTESPRDGVNGVVLAKNIAAGPALAKALKYLAEQGISLSASWK